MNDSSICLRPVNALLTDSSGNPRRFWIPSYQRGYRWKPLQVTQLLDDLWEFIQTTEEGDRKSFYCLQPLVIRALKDGRHEVVDGQQRLTTIYILLTYLKDLLTVLKKERFEITFETRGEANEPFLAEIDLERAEENVDFFHICEAYRAVEKWFSKKEELEALELLQYLLNNKPRNVQVIWFELSEGDNPVDAFTRLNVGKIPLTNDELIRALFLRQDGNGSEKSESLQLRIAYEWDLLEKALQDDAFWYFLRSQPGPKQNRIGFLFNLVAQADGLPEELRNDAYGVFYAYNLKLQNGAKVEDEWLNIKQAFMQLEEWFEDRTLYHTVGFLIYAGAPIADLRELSKECPKSAFEALLRQLVFDATIDGANLEGMNEDEVTERVQEKLSTLQYGGANLRRIRSLLLLFNIATLLDNDSSNIRFQFDSFKKGDWDIEHVRSVSDDQPQHRHERVEWMQHTLSFMESQGEEDELREEIKAFIVLPRGEEADATFEPLYEKVLKVFKENGGDEADHGVGNLTLLDSGTNRSYKNAVYAVKRKQLLKLDQAGIFVPLCTRNVFLKCYSSRVDNPIFWSKEDREAYQQVMVETLVRFFTHKGKAQ